jgi:hypothetical protein
LSRLRNFDFFWLKLQNLKPENFHTAEVPSIGRIEYLAFSGASLGGLCTPLGTICIHKKILEDSLLADFVLLHEYAHKKDPLRFVFYSTGVLVLALSLTGNFFGVLSTIVLTVFLSWVMELKAETYTAKHMGKKYFEATAKIKKLRKKKPPTIYRLINPPETLKTYIVKRTFLKHRIYNR